MLFSIPFASFSQMPDLGSTADFVLFSSNGAVSNTGISQLTGNIGTNNGSSTAFGNVNGTMHDGDAASIQASSDLLIAYNQLDSYIPTLFPSSTLGNGQSLVPGIYEINGAATLNLNLILDAQGNPDAVFVFQIQGSLSTTAASSVTLLNGAQACRVFWKIEGLVSLATQTKMLGTIISNNAAIEMYSGVTLEGRALSTGGAVTVDGLYGYTPIGCGSAVLNGPTAPDLGSAACYTIFSADGAVSNSGISSVKGDIGSNNGSATGFDPLLVNGMIHAIPDISTAQCALDLATAYTYINTLPMDIELLYPAQFGGNLVLTPHTYLLNGAVTFTDSLFLNAQNNPDAVFVIQINGALSTSTYAKVLLQNGAQAKNVYWKVEGAVSLNNYSVFCGTIICNNGALGAINTGVTLDGRALTTSGALTTTAMLATLPDVPVSCSNVGLNDLSSENESISFYPNPFAGEATLVLKNIQDYSQVQVRFSDLLGNQILMQTVTTSETLLDLKQLTSGIYFYEVSEGSILLKSGKIVSTL